jgi:uncharacterized protein YbcI
MDVSCARTRGELEAAICDVLIHFEREYLGRGPTDVQVIIARNIIVARLQGTLTVAERHFVESAPPDTARQIVKQTRAQIIDAGRARLENSINKLTSTRLVTLFYDVSVSDDEEIFVYCLDDCPVVRSHRSELTRV